MVSSSSGLLSLRQSVLERDLREQGRHTVLRRDGCLPMIAGASGEEIGAGPSNKVGFQPEIFCSRRTHNSLVLEGGEKHPYESLRPALVAGCLPGQKFGFFRSCVFVSAGCPARRPLALERSLAD
jgi:hypothetical protein